MTGFSWKHDNSVYLLGCADWASELRNTWLTHPDFSKLPGAQPPIQLERLTRDLPGILLPWFLGLGADAGVGEGLAEPITLLWNTDA